MHRLFAIILGILIAVPASASDWTLTASPIKKTKDGAIVFEPACPQVRKTQKAPDEIYNLKNPLEPTRENIFAGQTLFHFDARPGPCRVCHGISGNGLGILFRELSPGSRNFTCDHMMDNIPDGQLFWIIKNGSEGTAMPAFKNLEDDQIWQLVHYIRHFADRDE